METDNNRKERKVRKTEGARKTNLRLERRTHGSRYVRKSYKERK